MIDPWRKGCYEAKRRRNRDSLPLAEGISDSGMATGLLREKQPVKASEVINRKRNMDPEARIAQLEKELNDERVERGRNKKLSEEISALKEKLSRYESEEARRDASNELTDEQLNGLPREYADLAATVAQKVNASSRDSVDDIRQQLDTIKRDRFYSEIERANDGLFEAIGEGGDKKAAWDDYVSANEETYNAIIGSGNVDRFNRFVRGFYSDLGVPPSRNGYAVDPFSVGADSVPSPVNNGKKYSAAEISAMENRAMELRRSGKYDEYRKLRDEIDDAISAGRIA